MRIGEFLTKEFRLKIYEKYLTSDISYFERKENSPAALMSKITNDTIKINIIATSMLGFTLHTLVAILISVPLAFSSEWRLSLINVGFIPAIGIISFLTFKSQKKIEEISKRSNFESSVIVSEAVNNSKTIIAFNMRQEIINLFTKTITAENTDFIKSNILKCLFYGISQFLVFSLYALLFWYAGNYVKSDSTDFINQMFIPGFSFDPLEYSRLMVRCILVILFSGLGIGLAQKFVGDYSSAKQSLYQINLKLTAIGCYGRRIEFLMT